MDTRRRTARDLEGGVTAVTKVAWVGQPRDSSDLELPTLGTRSDKTRPLLVAESNPYGSDPRYALYPYPETSAGGRLCFKVLGLTRREYLSRFDRVNLCAGKWNMKEARGRAAEIYERNGWVVLFGARVCRAFDFSFLPFTTRGRHVILPHPSGLSRAWNEPGAFERARAVLREAGVL